MRLSIDITYRRKDFSLAAAFEAGPGITALFGKSGSGKSTLVHIIAGLITPFSGRITLGDHVLFDKAKRMNMPAYRRRVGCVFQEGLLFPHLNVRQNLLYGSWQQRRKGSQAQFEQVVQTLNITHLLARRPALLSGGEKQRVALGRALLSGPAILLMDEPLASLDEGSKAEIIPYLERVRDEWRLPIIYVSHAVSEVIALATDMAILSEGRILAHGALADVMGRFDLFPAVGRFEAGAVLEVCVIGHDNVYGLSCLAAPGGNIFVPGLNFPIGSKIRVRIRARDVIIAREAPRDISALNVLSGVVAHILEHANNPIAEVVIDIGGVLLQARITRRSIAALKLAPGVSVFAILKTVAIDHRSMGRFSGR